MNQAKNTLSMGFMSIALVLEELSGSAEKRKVERGILAIRDRFKYLGNLIVKPNAEKHRIAMMEMSQYRVKYASYKELCEEAQLCILEDLAEDHEEINFIEFLVISRDKENNINHLAVDISLKKPLAEMTIKERSRTLVYIARVFSFLQDLENTSMV